MTERERFYAERDRRTRERGVKSLFDVPVGITVGRDVAHSRNGQLVVLALVNLLARLHRHLVLLVPSASLVSPSQVSASRLDEAAFRLGRTIDPFIRLETVQGDAHLIGLGADAPGSPDWFAGAIGQIALVGRGPFDISPRDNPSLGASLAACLAAANLLRRVQQRHVRPARLSCWNFCEDRDAAVGPVLCGPTDGGDVLQVGAGGVGNCLAYWLSEFGVKGEWRVIDRDIAALHNTNRCMGMFPHQTEWQSAEAANKAEVAAKLFGGRSEPVWYHEFDHNSFKPDLVLPLANDFAVRHLVACRGEALVLHATTSRMGEAQFHRHIAGRDDCIVCRMPAPAQTAAFGCATVPLVVGERGSEDAALPFLSAAAGLVLLSGLYRLQYGDLPSEPFNLSAICFDDERRHGRRVTHQCSEGCNVVLAAAARRKIHAGRRWASLDPSFRTE